MMYKIFSRSVFFFGFFAVLFPYMAQANSSQQKVNKLADSLSPYLRQHQHNPVQWYEWGEEALSKAKAENKPILVSVGYSTCYWCHVLEREVFMHEDAAEIMNTYFVNIKVDREVRPDLDMVFMLATQMLSGSGGWPNNVFLTPDLKPFHGVTYMPKDYWLEMTQKVALLWQTQEDKLEEQAQRLSGNISTYLSSPPAVQVSLPINQLALRAVSEKRKTYDKRYGGFGAGVKFPEESDLLFLLDYARQNKDEGAMEMVQTTVDHMLAGGIHDHIGGGFHRYATEEQWHVPHFEKMLYNQAMMALVLARLYEDTEGARYKRALERLIAYVERDMTDADTGGFYSAQDAETDEVEGAYYVWRADTLEQALNADQHKALMDVYDLADIPDIPGHKSPEGGVLYAKKDIVETSDQLDDVLDVLLAVREKREAPSRDQKIITSWNGMMIYALAEAGRVLDNQDYIKTAQKAADFLMDNMRQNDGRLYRIYMEGQAHQNAFLSDYAWSAQAFVSMYRMTKEPRYLTATVDTISAAQKYLEDTKAGGFYMTDGSEGLFVRIKKGDTAGALPSGNAVMAHVYADLQALEGEDWSERLDGLMSAFAQGLSSQPHHYMYFLSAVMQPQSVAATSENQKPKPTLEDHGILPTSKDKVKVSAKLADTEIVMGEYEVRLFIDVEDGWHINANPASLPDLIPTKVNIQTEADSSYDVSYPAAHILETPIGELSVYRGQVEITVKLHAEDTKGLRALVQVQACKDATCYAPSLISVDL